MMKRHSAGTRGALLYLCHFAGTPENGMNYRPYHLGVHLSSLGYEVTIVAAGFHHQMRRPKNLGRLPVEERIDGVHYVWMPGRRYDPSSGLQRTLNLILFFLQLLRFPPRQYLRSRKVVAVVASSPSLFTSLNGLLLARRLRTRFVFEVRDLWPLSLVELMRVPRWNPLVVVLQLLEDLAYRTADVVVSVLPRSRSYMVRHGLRPSKFVYIPNGVDAEVSGEAVSPSRPSREHFVVGYLGSLGHINAIEHLVEAARLLRGDSTVRFVIVGAGPVRERLLAGSRGLPNVLFKEPVPKREVQSVLGTFDVAFIGWRVCPLYRYGVSANKLFDYMYASIPILQALSDGFDMVAAAACGLTVEAENPRAIAAGVVRMREMGSETLRAMGDNGRRYVLANHDYERLSVQFAQAIDRDGWD